MTDILSSERSGRRPRRWERQVRAGWWPRTNREAARDVPDARGHRLGKPKKPRRGRLELPISLKIPLDDIIMLPVARGFEAKLELRVAVMNADGERSEIPVIPVVLGGPTTPPPNSHAIYDTSLRLRKARQRLALALYDLASETIFSTSIDFDPDSI